MIFIKYRDRDCDFAKDKGSAIIGLEVEVLSAECRRASNLRDVPRGELDFWFARLWALINPPGHHKHFGFTGYSVGSHWQIVLADLYVVITITRRIHKITEEQKPDEYQ